MWSTGGTLIADAGAVAASTNGTKRVLQSIGVPGLAPRSLELTSLPFGTRLPLRGPTVISACAARRSRVGPTTFTLSSVTPMRFFSSKPRKASPPGVTLRTSRSTMSR